MSERASPGNQGRVKNISAGRWEKFDSRDTRGNMYRKTAEMALCLLKAAV
jgi:hypothetical protein